MGVAALGMASYAATFMYVEKNDGTVVKYGVEDVHQVYFGEDEVIPSDTTPVIPSDTLTSNHPYVDLGLPSGTLWATYNVGASKPEEYGDYFAWGETEPKEVYDWNTYKWGKIILKYNSEDGLTTLLPEDDAATANWGKEWRMPTTEEQRELVEECYWVWSNGYNGSDVRGHIVYKAKRFDDKGRVEYPGGNYQSEIEYNVSSDAHVFLPASGGRWDDELAYDGDSGGFWSSSLYEDYEYGAREFGFNEKEVGWDYGSDRRIGFPVRAVHAK